MTEREIEKIARKVAQYLWDMQNNERDWITIEETAKILQVNVRTVRDHRDEIGYVKRGKRIYFDRKRVNAYIEGK